MAIHEHDPRLGYEGDSSPRREPDILRRAFELALARTSDDRAWALVRLGADLRAMGDVPWALYALDLAWEQDPSLEPARAMFSCAIATHCDAERYEVANTIADEQPEEYHDLKFSRAACRLYSALLTDTGEERWLECLEHYSRHVRELE